MLLDLDDNPPPPLFESAWVVGLVTMVLNPVVVRASSALVEVTRETWPSAPVVLRTVEIRRVDVPTSAEVNVVRDVVSLLSDCDELPEVAGVDDGTSDVSVVLDVEGEVMTVGLPLVVEVVVRVNVVSLTEVVVSLSDPLVAAADDDGVTPVPACRLWKMPAMKWSSITSGIPSCAATEATSAPTSIGREKRILTAKRVCDVSYARR